MQLLPALTSISFTSKENRLPVSCYMSVWSRTVESIKLFRLLLLLLLLHLLPPVRLKQATVLIAVSWATCANIFHTTLVRGVASPFNRCLCDQEVTRVLLHPRGYHLTSAGLWRGNTSRPDGAERCLFNASISLWCHIELSSLRRDI